MNFRSFMITFCFGLWVSFSICEISSAGAPLKSNLCLIEGDIQCPRKSRTSFSNNRKLRSRSATKRSYLNAPKDFNILWPTRLIPYQIRSEYPPGQLAIIQRAINDIEKSTCLRFMPINGQQFTDFVTIFRGKGCYSTVGRSGGEQQISLDLGCFEEKTVYHELLHTIGFWHEHNRPDRDKYVKVLRENIDPVRLGNFKISDGYESELGSWDYDYYSVMHYKSTAYSRDGKTATLLPVDPNIPATDLGKSNTLTKRDIDKINSLYRCEVKTCSTPPLNDHVTFITPPAIENNYQIGGKVAYSCDSNGYTMVGSASQTCLSNGQWSGRYPRCLPLVSHYCDFESNGICGWWSVTSDTDWEKSTGRSYYRSGTGPITDLTFGTLDGHFLRLDTQNMDTGLRAIISTPTLPLPSRETNFCLSFGYYMWGLVVGTLRATLITESGKTKEIFAISGSQGPKWIETKVILAPDTSFRIEFESVIGSELGDIAIDDISIEPCSGFNRMASKRLGSKVRMQYHN